MIHFLRGPAYLNCGCGLERDHNTQVSVSPKRVDCEGCLQAMLDLKDRERDAIIEQMRVVQGGPRENHPEGVSAPAK